MRGCVTALVAFVALGFTSELRAAASLPRSSSQLLLVGDSVTAGVYFLSLDESSIRQAWSGQLLARLGLDPARAPFDHTYPINHLRLAQRGLAGGGLAYLWDARHTFNDGGPRFAADEERVVMAVPAQTLHEALTQSSLTRDENEHSSGWSFGKVLLPEGLSAIETIEQWNKRPEWIVLFIGANDLLSEFGIVGDARPPSPAHFEADYRELVARLRKRMPPEADSRQFFVLTLPDVTRLPLLQPLPPGADDGDGEHFANGSVSSAFLIPFRKHFQPDEVWLPERVAAIRQLARDYNEAIERIAREEGLTVVDIAALMEELRQDSTFVAPDSPYFSPDLVHPSFRTHAHIANRVADAMSNLTGEPVPPLADVENPLPASGDFVGKDHTRVAAMMRLAYLALESGPLPPRLTGRIGVEAAGQFGDEPVADATVSLLAGFELPPAPLVTVPVMRLGMSVRAAALAFNEDDESLELFPQRSLEGRLGLGFERIGMWTWTRFELGGLLTLDGAWDGGMYARGEWRGLYAEAAGRGWGFDRIEAGLRFGLQPGRRGRNGN